jgi:hypothetical protein
MWRRCCLLLLAAAGQAGAVAPLTMVVDTSAVMPEARIEGSRVLAGLHADLGAALAKQLGRPVQMRALPRKRIARATTRAPGCRARSPGAAASSPTRRCS